MNKLRYKNKQNGFMALTATLILMAVLMILMFTNTTSSFLARFDSLGSQFKRTSLGLSEACTNKALLKVAQDYNYDILTDSDYDDDYEGVVVNVGDDICIIKLIECVNGEYSCSDGNAPNKKLKIKTLSQYPNDNGSWSTNEIFATVQNPAISSTALPPICDSFTITPSGPPTPAQINSGQSVTLNWTTSNSTSFSIQRYTNSSSPYTLSQCTGLSGSCQDTPTESATYVGIATGINGLQTQCPTVSILVKPNFGECVDTVMMLDRTVSMFNDPQAVPDEQEAARTLLDLFATLFPHPLVGLGRFGDPTGQSADIVGHMTNDYGERAAPLSFGPQNPAKSSTANGLNQWSPQSNADKAKIKDGVYATDSTNGHKQGYLNFNFNIPTGAEIKGIEVIVDGKSSSNGNPQNSSNIYPTGIGNFNSWTANGNSNKVTDVNATDSNDNTYINTSTNNAIQTFVLPNANIPSNAVVNSVTFFAIARGTNNGANIKLVLEDSNSLGHQWPDGGHTLTTSYQSYRYNNSSTLLNPATGLAWTVQDVNTWANNGKLRFGVQRNNSANISPRVTQIYAVINYTVSPSINVDLSWNNGGSWTTGSDIGIKTVPLTTIDPLIGVKVGSPTDTWGRNWTLNDFTNNNFILRLTNNSVSGNIISVDYVNVKIYYTSSTGLYAHIDNDLDDIGSYTNLGDAIKVSADELKNNGDSTKENVLILVSDGLNVNRPCSGNCGASSTIYAQNWATTKANEAKNLPGGQAVKIFMMHFGGLIESGSGLPCTGVCFLQTLVSPSNIPIANITSTGAKRTGNTVTITTTSEHKLSLNQRVVIAGVSNNIFNGNFAITYIPSSTTFTYQTTSSGNTNSGNGTVTPTNLFEAPNSDDMDDVFTAIGNQVCPALSNPASPAPVPNPPPPPSNPSSIQISSWNEVLNLP